MVGDGASAVNELIALRQRAEGYGVKIAVESVERLCCVSGLGVAAVRQTQQEHAAEPLAEELWQALTDMARHLTQNGARIYTHTQKLGRFKKFRCPTGFVPHRRRAGSHPTCSIVSINALTPDGQLFYYQYPEYDWRDGAPQLKYEDCSASRLVAGEVVIGELVVSVGDGGLCLRAYDEYTPPFYEFLASLSQRVSTTPLESD
ncbi:hypothetical protein M2432_003368 [Mycobacterium sp. OTB74]|jgi:hypothetical protein|nr:hypothetical protein [Mycobacterium sp. OTB74]